MELESKCKIYPINILSLIDTDYVLSNYPPDPELIDGQLPPKHPVLIDSQAARMICQDARGPVSGEGTTNLSFKARKGDYIFFRGMSTSGNSDDAIIIYNVHEEDHHHVFGVFSGDETSLEDAAEPSTETSNGMPAVHGPADFLSVCAKIRKHGTTNLLIQFGLYKLDDNAETQSLYGYFEWKAKITVETV